MTKKTKFIMVAEGAHVIIESSTGRMTYAPAQCKSPVCSVEAQDARVFIAGKPTAWLQIGVGPNEGQVVTRLTKPRIYNKDWWRFEPLFGGTAP